MQNVYDGELYVTGIGAKDHTPGDSAIDQGDSGGLIFNEQEEFIGIVSIGKEYQHPLAGGAIQIRQSSRFVDLTSRWARDFIKANVVSREDSLRK